MIKVDRVSKQYRLGQIGGTTLREELQRKAAKLLKKEDPTKKIGEKDYEFGETFMALEDVSFEVKKGERLAIIGHNGAGKSTLLKLLSRVTAPSTGGIGLNGRIASMLEVGTGFHPELTGRENVYMNGAILGMTKKEIDKKIDDIIEFSEVRQFIDTPVKRYSSGMFVKLAFSVAAHLDAEIMLMDEVLAVGDMAFQTKCLNKMNDLAKNEGKTILYVSHNMNTVRKLCNRAMVLEHGRVVFNGSVEEGIACYLKDDEDASLHFDFDNAKRPYGGIGDKFRALSLDFLDGRTQFKYNEPIVSRFKFKTECPFKAVRLRAEAYYFDGTEIGNYETDSFEVDSAGEHILNISFMPDILPIGQYYLIINIYEVDLMNNHKVLDQPSQRIPFEIYEDDPTGIRWNHEYMGHVRMGKIKVSDTSF
ncbi:MAG: ABC transporter ATP-binding protein [Ruminococcus sp.]|nr:ABC transporter ATP-binding protein [Ruminococcus sp.]